MAYKSTVNRQSIFRISFNQLTVIDEFTRHGKVSEFCVLISILIMRIKH